MTKKQIPDGSLVGINLVALDGSKSTVHGTGRVIRSVVSPDGELCAYVVAISGWPQGGYMVGDTFAVSPEKVVAQ